jgi:hypothetical protein
MKHKRNLIQPALSLVALLGSAAFLNAAPARRNPNVHLGPEVPMGNGTIQTYTRLNPAGKPSEVGVYFTAKALEALPTGPSDGTWDILDAADNVVYHCCGHEFFLEFPAEVQPYIPFQYAIVNWNPEGHVPPGVYNLPHFDFHFYTFANEERLTIEAPLDTEMCIVDGNPVPLTCEDFETAMKPIPADQLPPGYANVGAVEPGMGNHLIDFSSHEWHGVPFDHTWIFGIYDGRMTFWEPMITHAFLTSLQPGKENKGPKQVTIPISTPQAAPEAGYYPTKYQIAYHPALDGYTVSLTSMKFLLQSSGK